MCPHVYACVCVCVGGEAGSGTGCKILLFIVDIRVKISEPNDLSLLCLQMFSLTIMSTFFFAGHHH